MATEEPGRFGRKDKSAAIGLWQLFQIRQERPSIRRVLGFIPQGPLTTKKSPLHMQSRNYLEEVTRKIAIQIPLGFSTSLNSGR